MSEAEEVLVVNFQFFSFLALLFLLSLLLSPASGDEKANLLQLKHFLQENNKYSHGRYSQWNSSNSSENSPCQWFGITCNDEQHVTGIDLSSSNISGGLFDGFHLFPELTHLDLSQNTIEGPIPPEINKCRALTYLNLSHNIISGELNLTGLTNLHTLDITLNRLEGSIASNFPALCQSLVILNISSNNFTGDIHGSFDECKKLQYLDVSSNHFTGDIWRGFAYLREFCVSENNFTGEITVETFGADCNLEVLDLSVNNLHGEFPESISNCSSLKSLNLRANGFTGVIPSSIGELSELQSLYLGSNRFDGNLPEQLLQCSNLIFLDLSNNSFGGDVQDLFGKLKSVRFLLLHGNSYQGGIEKSGVLQLANIERLDLSYNNFSGELPAKLDEMKQLKFLVFAWNNFSGRIPPEYGNITGLQALDLSYNNLTGPIPPEIGRLESLLWLMLAGNRISGAIPPEIGNCKSLLWLNLADNEISGRIPPEISKIGRDPSATFEANRRNDGVTAGSGECLAMRRWIPATYPPFSFVYELMTAKTCRFIWDRIIKGYGLFPVCINSSSPVQTLEISGYIQLSRNNLSGEIPAEIGDITNISLLHLDGNNLSGHLPAKISRLPLFILNVSTNRLSGQIPPEIGSMQCLQMLDLAVNNFSGKFPSTLVHLNELSSFNVSFNPLLSGSIPQEGQLPTFGNASFLGDPLLVFPSLRTAPPPTPAAGRRVTGLAVAFWVFLALTAVFILSGTITVIYCLGIRTPIKTDPDPEGAFLSGSKRRSDAAVSDSLSPSTSANDVKIFRLDKTAFTYADIVTATGNFSDKYVLGTGGSGTVYKGVLPDGRHVAVKKLNRVGEEGEREFRAEMEVLAGSVGPWFKLGSGWAHPNLVTLYGWCLKGLDRILIYEYMDGGSLEEMIPEWGKFGWERRVKVSVEVARALVFLHHECVPAVVHRDVKASNVLLDKHGRARVADFGLARVVSPGHSHVSTMVAGTVGYVAPEYGQTWQATTKGDVYSFGVLVMELAIGRRAVDEKDECLIEWVRRFSKEGWWGLRAAVVPILRGVMGMKMDEDVEGLAEMCALLRVGVRCVAETPLARPTMSEVLVMLNNISIGIDTRIDFYSFSSGSGSGSGSGFDQEFSSPR
ncbi:Non-specific serine/threonine protein kinase protein [Dioscorea alata]|uniref:Non-specific serine/threonine protein kinase protein n=1 Tax=Dioscorea alata TaxID=55571 RepID=A0ACB7UWN4_DIOAL|nr:Non-specific serine/threonine protein kinase protein [Dioscorea alata]